MSAQFLSREDIAAMTRTPFRKKQIEFFVRNGIRHYVDGFGWPVVTWSAIDGSQTATAITKTWKSNKAA